MTEELPVQSIIRNGYGNPILSLRQSNHGTGSGPANTMTTFDLNLQGKYLNKQAEEANISRTSIKEVGHRVDLYVVKPEARVKVLWTKEDYSNIFQPQYKVGDSGFRSEYINWDRVAEDWDAIKLTEEFFKSMAGITPQSFNMSYRPCTIWLKYMLDYKGTMDPAKEKKAKKKVQPTTTQSIRSRAESLGRRTVWAFGDVYPIAPMPEENLLSEDRNLSGEESPRPGTAIEFDAGSTAFDEFNIRLWSRTLRGAPTGFKLSFDSGEVYLDEGDYYMLDDRHLILVENGMFQLRRTGSMEVVASYTPGTLFFVTELPSTSGCIHQIKHKYTFVEDTSEEDYRFSIGFSDQYFQGDGGMDLGLPLGGTIRDAGDNLVYINNGLALMQTLPARVKVDHRFYADVTNGRIVRRRPDGGTPNLEAQSTPMNRRIRNSDFRLEGPVSGLRSDIPELDRMLQDSDIRAIGAAYERHRREAGTHLVVPSSLERAAREMVGTASNPQNVQSDSATEEARPISETDVDGVDVWDIGYDSSNWDLNISETI